MKQTIAILTALMLSLLLVSGFIVAGSTELSHTLAQREEQLLSLSQELKEATDRADCLEREAQRSVQALEALTEERDLLLQQRDDALLSSREANEAVAVQASDLQALKERMEEAAQEAQATLLTQERQAAEDAAVIASLKQALELALASPTATPAPLPTILFPLRPELPMP